MTNFKVELRNFFNVWFFISLSIILVSLLIKQNVGFHDLSRNIIIILSDMLQSIGLAIIVANIFNYIIGTKKFIEYIRERLIDIVLSKEFVTRLNDDDQRKLLKLTLKPTKELTAIYSGIDDYFDSYIDSSMKLFDSCYRGQMNIIADCTYDSEDKCIKIEWDLTYTLYKVAEKFESIPFWLGDEKSQHIETHIIADKIEKKVFKNSDLIKMENVQDPSMNSGYYLDVPDNFNKYNEVTVKRRFIEYGNDHWQIFCYKAVKPCHKLFVTLICSENLSIKEPNTFGAQEEFIIEQIKNKVMFSYNGWLSPGYGVSALISLNEFHKEY